jgi:hypothetical protein
MRDGREGFLSSTLNPKSAAGNLQTAQAHAALSMLRRKGERRRAVRTPSKE